MHWKPLKQQKANKTCTNLQPTIKKFKLFDDPHGENEKKSLFLCLVLAVKTMKIVNEIRRAASMVIYGSSFTYLKETINTSMMDMM